MQLTRALALATIVVLIGSVGFACAPQVEAAHRTTLFQEPSKTQGNAGITVIHPQTDVAATWVGSGVGLAVGHELDAVSGATPRVFGIDTITSATKFSDTRQQLRGALTYTRPVAEVTAGYSYGWENDYRSNAVTVTTRSDIFDHVFTIAVSYTHNFDQVCDASNLGTLGRAMREALPSSANCFKGTPDVATRHLNIDAVEPSITWAVTPRLLLQSGGTAQILDGFQANPYRRVQLGRSGLRPQESLPDLRQRYAVFARGAYALPRLHASIQAMARVYRDTWAVQAASAEVSLHQYITKFLLWSARGRMHVQSGASFYQDAAGYATFGPNGQYWTGDRELSPMQNFLVGGKVSYLRIPEGGMPSFFNEIEASLKAEGLFYQLASTTAPNADRKLAMIYQLALALRF